MDLNYRTHEFLNIDRENLEYLHIASLFSIIALEVDVTDVSTVKQKNY